MDTLYMKKIMILFMRVSICVLFCAELLFARSAFSQTETLEITLVDAIFLGLERNPTVTIQRLEPQIAKSYVDEHRAAFDPTLTLSGNKSQDKTQRFLGSRPDPFEMTSDRFQYNLSISEMLPTGTSIVADATMNGSASSIYSDQYTGSIGLTITQSLLRGFGPGVNLADLRKARLDLDISNAELKGIAEQLVSDIETAYWELYLASEEIAINKKSLDLADRQLQESEERVEVGKLAELELAAVHAELATRQEALIDAESNYEQARLGFLYLLNPSEERLWEIVPNLMDKPFIPVDTLDAVDVHVKIGMKNRPDLEQARLSYKKGELEITQTKNGLLPKLDLFITLGRTTYSRTFKESIPDINSPFYGINIGATLELPVPNRQARAQAARARFSKEQLLLSLQNMERLVQWDVRSAYVEALRLRQQIVATRVTRELQEKNLDAELEKFRVGKSTNLLVLQVQRDFTASQLDEIRAMVAYLNSLTNLYLMEGSLLERHGIKAPGEDVN